MEQLNPLPVRGDGGVAVRASGTATAVESPFPFALGLPRTEFESPSSPGVEDSFVSSKRHGRGESTRTPAPLDSFSSSAIL
jgi:hypothetical protein